jgi:antitoxin MazE
MTIKLVPIGNSKGIRLPKAILQASGLEESATLRLEGGKVIITPARTRRKPRAGWARAIEAELRRGGPLKDLDPNWERLSTSWDDKGWR